MNTQNIKFKNPILLVKNGVTNTSPPIKITLENEDVEFQLLKGAKILKEINKKENMNISISQDLNEVDRLLHKKLLQEKKELNVKLANDNITNYYYGIRGNKVVKIDKGWCNYNLININDQLSKNFFNNEICHNINYLDRENVSISKSNQIKRLNICSLNTNAVKRNLNYIQELISKNDFIFLCKTWLMGHEASFLKSLSSTHLVFTKSDMKTIPLIGRPYGGRAFIYKKTLHLLKHSFINKHISFFSFSLHNNIFTLITVYLPFDNNSFFNFSEFKTNLQIIKELFDIYIARQHSVFVIGDFNADLKRNNKFDYEFNNYLNENNFFCVSPSLNLNEFSYSNG